MYLSYENGETNHLVYSEPKLEIISICQRSIKRNLESKTHMTYL